MILGLGKLAIRNTLRRGKKSWITVIGVFIGIAAVVSLVSLGQGLEKGISQEFEELGSNQVIVQGEIDDSDNSVVSGTRGVDEVVGVYRRTDTVEFRGEEQRVSVVGADTSKFDTAFRGLPLEMEGGRKLRRGDISSAMISQDLPESFENDMTVNSILGFKSAKFRVQGIYSSGSPEFQNSIIIGLERSRDLWGVEDELSQIVAVVEPGFSQENVAESIEDEIRDDRDQDEGEENFTVTTPQDILESLKNILNIVQGIVIGLASISLLVGAVGIMNTMYMSINERKQEIGTLKAVGASRRQIRTLFLMEAGIIGLLGGLIGVGIGIGISEIVVYAASRFSSVAIARGYDLTLIGFALSFSVLLGVFSGYLPSRQASNLDPADALRYE